MASIKTKDGVLVNISATAPSPCKDYCQLVVTENEVIYRRWRISLKDVKYQSPAGPKEIKDSYADFECDDTLKAELQVIFGNNVVSYINGIIDGHYDYLVRLPKNVMIKIIKNLPLEDIAMIGCTCKALRQFSRSDDLWQSLYRDNIKSKVEESDKVLQLAGAVGWREVFFMNKLELKLKTRQISSRMSEEFRSSPQPPSNLLTPGGDSLANDLKQELVIDNDFVPTAPSPDIDINLNDYEAMDEKGDTIKEQAFVHGTVNNAMLSKNRYRLPGDQIQRQESDLRLESVNSGIATPSQVIVTNELNEKQ